MTYPQVRAAAGLRRADIWSREAERLADGFRGLPEGGTRWRLVAALRTAATDLGLTASQLRLIEHYVDLTYDVDWTAGCEPVVTRPLVEIAEHLGLSERQVRNLESALMRKGLLAWRDSGNHHRRGRRDRASGRLIYAYGPSLAPLGARWEEMLRRAAESRAALAQVRTARLAISALRRRLRAALAEAETAGVDLDAAAEAYGALPERNPAGTPAAHLERQRERLRDLVDKAEARLTAAAAERTTRKAGEAEICSRHTTDTKKEKDKVVPESLTSHDATPKKIGMTKRCRPTSREDRTSLKRLIEAAHPEIRWRLEIGGATWSSFIDAARERGLTLGLREADWSEACATVGRLEAALCAMVLDGAMNGETKACGKRQQTRRPIASPGAYFRALAKRSERGALNFEASLRGIERSGWRQSETGNQIGGPATPRRSEASAWL